MSTDFDLGIVGLGALGSAVCSALATDPATSSLRIAAFDRHPLRNDKGSSHGHTRIIREAYWEDPLYVPLVRRAYELWQELEVFAERPLLETPGGLMVGPEDWPLVSGARKSAERYGIDVELLDQADLERKFGHVFQDFAGCAGVLEPRGGFLWLEPCLEAMHRRSRNSGIELYPETEVTGFAPEKKRHADSGGYRLALADGREMVCRRLLLCCSGWLPTLVPGLEGLEVMRQVQHWVALEKAEAEFEPESFPCFLWEDEPGDNWYGFPNAGRGFKVGIHHRGEITSIERLERNIRPQDLEVVRSKLRRHIPRLAERAVQSSSCFYTNTPDHDFLIDWHPHHHQDDGGVLIATACSGHGFKFMTALGEILAQLLTDREPDFDLAPFRWRKGLRIRPE
jgi:sarcosine oxidase